MKNCLKRLIITIAVAISVLALWGLPLRLTNASHLSEGIWANSLVGCPVDEVDTELVNYTATGIAFKSGLTGDILGRCNVENLPIVQGEADFLTVSYKDPDGSGTTCQVVGKLQRVSNSGSLSTVATFDSNSFPASSEVLTNSVSFDHDFNFVENAYYVSGRVTRTDSTVDCFANIVRLSGGPA